MDCTSRTARAGVARQSTLDKKLTPERLKLPRRRLRYYSEQKLWKRTGEEVVSAIGASACVYQEDNILATLQLSDDFAEIIFVVHRLPVDFHDYHAGLQLKIRWFAGIARPSSAGDAERRSSVWMNWGLVDARRINRSADPPLYDVNQCPLEVAELSGV